MIKMSDKTFKFNDVEVNEKEFHASKQPIALNPVLINKIVVSDKFTTEEKICLLRLKIIMFW